MKRLTRVGTDDFYRPVYRDEEGWLYKDLNHGNGTLDLHDVTGKDLEGEPNERIKDEYEIISYDVIRPCDTCENAGDDESDEPSNCYFCIGFENYKPTGRNG